MPLHTPLATDSKEVRETPSTNAIPQALNQRQTATALARAARAVLHTLLLATGLWLGCVGHASAHVAQQNEAPTLLIIPFDAYNYEMDPRPGVQAQFDRWTAELGPEIGQRLHLGKKFRVLSNSAIKQQYDKLRHTYVHPSQCKSCMMKIAQDVGADYVVLGQVHKLSGLITYFPVRVDATKTGCTVLTIDMRVDGADSNAMWRHIAANISSTIDTRPFQTKDCEDAKSGSGT